MITNSHIAPKSGAEHLTLNGEKTHFNLLDFWRWSASDLLSNATRGKIAEFIVATTVNFDFSNVRQEWDEYDIKTIEGIRIEVKSAAYIQSWDQKRPSAIRFSIKQNCRTKCRNSDIYVFCILQHADKELVNPLELSQWAFVVIPTPLLNTHNKDQKTISLNSLLKLAPVIDYTKLTQEIIEASKTIIKIESQ